MTLVVLDTDVTSRVIKGTVPDSLAAKLAGKQLTITFVTVGELRRWTVLRELGERRRASVEQWMTGVSLGGDQEVARKWGEITAYAQLRGRPRPYDDSWIAACALTYDLPLATLNVKHFEDYAEPRGPDDHHGVGSRRPDRDGDGGQRDMAAILDRCQPGATRPRRRTGRGESCRLSVGPRLRSSDPS